MDRDVNPYIDRVVIARCLNKSLSTGSRIVQEINKELKAQGFSTIYGNIPASEFEKKYPIDRSTILYFYDKLGYNDFERDKKND